MSQLNSDITWRLIPSSQDDEVSGRDLGYDTMQ